MKHILLMIALLCVAFPAFAATQDRDDRAEIARAEKYLAGLTTAKARFLQIAPDGYQLIGTFYLNRPGRLRFEYDDPVKDFVVADGTFIYFYDAQLGEQSNAPIGQTLADFILRKDVRLSGDISVSEVKRGGGMIQITLIQADDPGAGAITLGFQEEPYHLKKWRVRDTTGAVTEVELFQLQTGLTLDRNLFFYHAPRDNRPRYNQ